jgi:hypothetical protein
MGVRRDGRRPAGRNPWIARAAARWPPGTKGGGPDEYHERRPSPAATRHRGYGLARLCRLPRRGSRPVLSSRHLRCLRASDRRSQADMPNVSGLQALSAMGAGARRRWRLGGTTEEERRKHKRSRALGDSSSAKEARWQGWPPRYSSSWVRWSRCSAASPCGTPGRRLWPGPSWRPTGCGRCCSPRSATTSARRWPRRRPRSAACVQTTSS